MTKPQKIRKVVFPVAGLGTRFLPATKSIPKEMLPIADRPLIQYGVEEAREAGITEFIFVTSKGKNEIEDHFDKDVFLIETLQKRNKTEALKILEQISRPGDNFTSVRQAEPLGLGHAVWCARGLVGNEPFAVILPDDLILGKVGCLKQMVELYEQKGGNYCAIEEVPRELTRSYGIIDPADPKDVKGSLVKIKGLVEKPDPAVAPSNLSIIGRYILQPEIFDLLGQHQKGAGGEIQLTDGMQKLLQNQAFYGVNFKGVRYDCGNKFGFLRANIAFALKQPDVREDLLAFMKVILAEELEQALKVK